MYHLLSYDQGNVQRRDEDLDGADLLDGKQDDCQYQGLVTVAERIYGDRIDLVHAGQTPRGLWIVAVRLVMVGGHKIGGRHC